VELITQGIWGLHGSTAFTSLSQSPHFLAVYQSFVKLELKSDFHFRTFIEEIRFELETSLKKDFNSTCARFIIFSKAVLKSLEQLALQESCPIWACNYLERFNMPDF